LESIRASKYQYGDKYEKESGNQNRRFEKVP
jgi:hypothetical protein